jgi:acetyl-CoA acetyltransferase
LRDAVIVEAVRTPIAKGKSNGAYAGVHPVDLHAHALRSAVERLPGLDRLATTLLGVLDRTGGRFGLQTMCEGGGTANATIIERL